MPLRSHGRPGKPVISGPSLNKAQVSKLQKGKGGALMHLFQGLEHIIFAYSRAPERETELWPESDMQTHCEI